METFRIRGGEPASWERTFNWNGVAPRPAVPGLHGREQRVSGFQSRHLGQVVALEHRPVRGPGDRCPRELGGGRGVRVEDHEHFGATTNGKLSSRIELAADWRCGARRARAFASPRRGSPMQSTPPPSREAKGRAPALHRLHHRAGERRRAGARRRGAGTREVRKRFRGPGLRPPSGRRRRWTASGSACGTGWRCPGTSN